MVGTIGGAETYPLDRNVPVRPVLCAAALVCQPVAMHNLRLTGLIMALTACCGFAGSLSYEMTGTLPGDAPLNLYSGPGLAFKVTFDLPVEPTPTGVFGYYFDVLPENARYTLGSQLTVDIPNALLSVYDFDSFGMFNLLISSTPFARFELTGPVIYSGTLNNPTMLAGTFTSNAYFSGIQTSNFSAFFVGPSVTQANWLPMSDVVVVQAETPEPVTGLLVGAAFLGLAVFRRRFR